MALQVCNSFIRGSDSRLVFPVATEKRKNLCLRISAASLRQVNQESHGQDKGPGLPHTWLTFLTRLSWKSPGDRLRKDANVICTNTAVIPDGVVEILDTDTESERVRNSSKKASISRTRAWLTPQIASELKKKLREFESFHDLLYHSALASRMAGRDN
ncbi:hypothetical protein KP509_10G057700 [Ceratopteris richardii]|uniref:Uncharacterized protein n=1 Tax=Ceratopteris richardii TaxID=49495 RepID=A0A8T2TVM2_CERRI|nr:hypothetical protein KP509_10G057700 [Ceratopteris richardii]